MRPSTRIGRTCFLAVQILVILVILCPILYALDISFLPLSQIFGKPLKLIPHEPRIQMMAMTVKDMMIRNTGRWMGISGHSVMVILIGISGDICIIMETTTGITLTRMAIW